MSGRNTGGRENYSEAKWETRSDVSMIILAVVCTLVAGGIGAFLEPVSFSVALPIAVMGGFILNAIQNKSK
jgi:hypothetical protein